MPTGYTAAVLAGKQNFQEFLWYAARAFGALVHLRERSGFDITYPEDQKTSAEVQGYHRTCVERARADLDQCASLEAFVEYRKRKYDESIASYRKRKAEYDLELVRFNEVRDEVVGWEPPTKDHEGLKEFMLQQLSVSRPYRPAKPTPLADEVLKADHESRLKELRETIEYHEKKTREDEDRSSGRREWIDQLHASVPIPPAWDKRGK